MKNYRIIIFGTALLIILSESTVNRVFGKFGSVKIDLQGTSAWGSSWPEGIKLVNNIRAASLPRSSQFANTSGYPYSTLEISTPIKPVLSRKTFSWTIADELLITVNMTSLLNPTCTRLIPPINWLTSLPSSKAKVLQNTNHRLEFDQESRFVEITVRKKFIENSLNDLRLHGFNNTDIYRMLDKGPWVLAFDIPSTMNRLSTDLQLALGINQAAVVHIVSHCPFLIAQYSRYKGRDVQSTVKALLDIGYTQDALNAEIARFPSMLAAPADRILGWMNFLNTFNIASNGKNFSKFLRKAPYMFNLNPPPLFGVEDDYLYASSSSSFESNQSPNPSVSVSVYPSQSNGFILFDALRILNLLSDLNLLDMDKIIRTQPDLLLVPAKEIHARLNYLLNILNSPSQETNASNEMESSDTDSCTKIFGGELNFDVTKLVKKHPHLQTQLSTLVQSYPAVLSIEVNQMKEATYALREVGLKDIEIKKLIRMYPRLLQLSSVSLKGSIFFLRQNCGLHKEELFPFVCKYPAVLSSDTSELLLLVDYLVKSVGVTTSDLKKHPLFLSRDLVTFYMPRCELLKALHKNPLMNGLAFLYKSTDEQFALAVGVSLDVYFRFKNIFETKWKSNSIQLQFGRVELNDYGKARSSGNIAANFQSS